REVRQPEVARLGGLLFALVLLVPVAHAGRRTLWAGAFLVEFLSQGRLAPLSALTSAPTREPLSVPGAAVDRYVLAGPAGGTPLVLVHGFTPEGKDDPRLREAAALLARCGFDVAVPTIPGLTHGRLRPDDVAPVVTTLAALGRPSIVLGVSVGAGPALLAAADPRVRERVQAVVTLGGYASAREVLRFWLTGVYAYGGVRGRVAHEPEVVRSFVAANTDLLEPAARAAARARALPRRPVAAARGGRHACASGPDSRPERPGGPLHGDPPARGRPARAHHARPRRQRGARGGRRRLAGWARLPRALARHVRAAQRLSGPRPVGSRRRSRKTPTLLKCPGRSPRRGSPGVFVEDLLTRFEGNAPIGARARPWKSSTLTGAFGGSTMRRDLAVLVMALSSAVLLFAAVHAQPRADRRGASPL
ncbi:MAG: alpha/beta fold hydrolase, partial [Deltaproteobacteria bacterium]